jgi:SEC-C motif-containing protein
MKPAKNKPCPCQSGRKFKSCCAPILSGVEATSPLVLMRSRYTAYALGVVQHIIDTTHPDGPHFREDIHLWRADLQRFCQTMKFEGLTILDTQSAQDGAQVHFRAHLSENGEDHSFSELSLFYQINRRWLYHSAQT